MKFVLTFVGLFLCQIMFSQKNIEYVESEVYNIETVLAKHSEKIRLTNSQKTDLYAIFENKYTRLNTAVEVAFDKYDRHLAIMKIETEFRPKVEAILSLEQRLAYQKKSPSVVTK